LLRSGARQGRRATAIVDQSDHAVAMRSVLESVRPGDFIVMQCDEGSAETTLHLLRHWIEQN
jgi:cyanophycin synthetase